MRSSTDLAGLVVHLVLVARALGDLDDDRQGAVAHAAKSSGGSAGIIPSRPHGRKIHAGFDRGRPRAREGAPDPRGSPWTKPRATPSFGSTSSTALETEDFEALPGDVFVRGALRTYAQYLGLYPDKVIGDLRPSRR